MVEYSPHIRVALAEMGEMSETNLEAFRTSWGSFEIPGLRRALHAGSDYDRLFAIWALGATRSEEARAELLPLLESTQPLERWASALALGELREQRSLPVLWRMLTELLPPNTDEHAVTISDVEYRASEFYHAWRPTIPLVLGEWGRPESVSPLRTGLQAALRVELSLHPADESYRSDVYYWSLYEDALVYALGRLGGFGALAGIEGAETPSTRYPGISGDTGSLPQQAHLEQWCVDMVMGALHGRYPLEGDWTFARTPGLLQEVTRMLAHIFGIRSEEAAPALRRYEMEMGLYLSQLLHRERTHVDRDDTN